MSLRSPLCLFVVVLCFKQDSQVPLLVQKLQLNFSI